SSSTQGYVVYQMTFDKGGNQSNFVLNESSAPTNQNGFADLTFALTSSLQNVTYSRVVNTSAVPEIFPFVPGITNQSFSYAAHGVAISAQLSTAGASSVTLNGASYSASKYLLDLSATNSSNGQSVSATGTLLALPSGLLYSLQIQEAGSSASSAFVQLMSTNLPLNDPSNASSTTEGAAMVGAGLLGAAALAVPFWKFRKRKNSAAGPSGSKEKPSYWVD
ncbi:MAG: hypothetical protein PXY39_12025, partial [archaeon]|nr:hypothetical protein [archaeon]